VHVKVLFFGQLKDIVGCSEDSLDLPEGALLQTVFELYQERFPQLQHLASSTVIARNHEFAPPSAPVHAGDEIAFLPPVSGGSGTAAASPAPPYAQKICDDPPGHFFALTRHPIDTAGIRDAVLAAEDGAVIVFEGVVRNNTKGRATTFLDYECYEAMAVKLMAQIGRELADSYAIGRIAMVHRLGRLAIGEASVAIVVSAPHRGPAFAAALEGINRLKRLVPIWKKEHFADGEVWVEGEWDESVRPS